MQTVVQQISDNYLFSSVYVSEPSVYGNEGQVILSPEQLAKDYVTFHRVLKAYPCFNESRVVGPDIFPVTYIPDGQKMIQA